MEPEGFAPLHEIYYNKRAITKETYSDLYKMFDNHIENSNAPYRPSGDGRTDRTAPPRSRCAPPA